MSHRGPSGYGIGGPSPYAGGSVGGVGVSDESNGGSVLDQLRPYTSKVEDALDSISEPVKP
jgi:hypothetical protein